MENITDINEVKSITTKEQNNNLPERKFRSGAISATVWVNQAVSKEGKEISYKTVSFERSYKGADEKWHTTKSLRMNDLPKAALVLQKAYEHLALGGEENS